MEDKTNNQRGSFADVRRTLRVLREEAKDASWFTTRHAEVCLYCWDYQTDLGLEVNNLPELLGLDQSTINRILHTLGERSNRQSLGWIKILVDQQDRRKRRVFFTENGRYVMNRLLNPDENTKKVDHYLKANDIIMKAEVGTVEVKTFPAELKVTRAMDAKEALRLEKEGEVIRIMHPNQSRWAIYDTDDINYSMPLAFQKDMPKEAITAMSDALAAFTIDFVKSGKGEEQYDLKERLTELMTTLNKDEYYRLRGNVMEKIAKAVEMVREEAAKHKQRANRHAQNAGELLTRVGQMPDTQQHDRMEMFGVAKDEMGKAAEAEKDVHKAEVESDQMGQLMAMLMDLKEDNASLRKEMREMKGYGAGSYGKGAYGGSKAEGDGD